MSLCILAGGAVTRLAAAAFTLSWTHSVERIPWAEDWQVTPAGLVLVEARMQGSGAGMEPPDGAVFDGTWWRHRPAPSPLPQLVLGNSREAGTWRLCAGADCRELGGTGEAPIVIEPCG